MAKELSIQISRAFKRSGVNYPAVGETNTIDVNSSKIVSGSRSIPTSETQITISPIVTIAAIWIENNGTNFITYGCVTGQLTSKLLPGHSILYVPTANAFFLQADTASNDVAFEIYGNS